MKVTRIILYTLGIILLLLNVISGIHVLKTPPEDSAERIGFYFGYVLFFIPGIVFILLGRSMTRKMRRKKEKALIDSLPE